MIAPFRGYLLLSLLVGCQRSRPEPGPASPASASTATAVAAAGAQAPMPRPTGPLSQPWREALAEPDDPIALARLAEAEGAAGLVDALDEDSARAPLALAALPYADDADAAAAALAARLRSASPQALDALLASAEGVAARKRPQREPLDPEGLRACYEALAAVAARAELPAPLRARAVSAARLLAERIRPPHLPLPGQFDR